MRACVRVCVYCVRACVLVVCLCLCVLDVYVFLWVVLCVFMGADVCIHVRFACVIVRMYV